MKKINNRKNPQTDFLLSFRFFLIFIKLCNLEHRLLAIAKESGKAIFSVHQFGSRREQDAFAIKNEQETQ
jgi:hypothetical protein